MIFSPEMVRLIVAGRKTVTRRPIKGDEDRGRYQVGHSYAVQPGRGRPAALRILVTDVRQEPLGELTLADARAEGFRTSDEFRLYWVRLHDRPWMRRTEDAFCEPLEDDLLLARFGHRHAQRQVWVITFELDHTHTPRLLAARPAPDYVSTPALALPGEPEAVTEAEQAWITAQSGTMTQQWIALAEGHREKDLRLLSLEERITRARRVARLRNVDIEREIWLVERLRQQGRTDEAVVHKLRGAERKLDAAAKEVA